MLCKLYFYLYYFIVVLLFFLIFSIRSWLNPQRQNTYRGLTVHICICTYTDREGGAQDTLPSKNQNS